MDAAGLIGAGTKTAMPSIDPQRWLRLSPPLDVLLDRPSAERGPWLDDLAPREPALAGRRISACTRLEPLGEGGMGSGWLAERSDGRFESRA